MIMLAPSDRGLILYQAYGNLYAMTGHTTSIYTSWASLEDKRIVVMFVLLSPRVIVVMVCPFVTTCYYTSLTITDAIDSGPEPSFDRPAISGVCVRIKSLHEVTVVKVRVNAAKLNLVLFKNGNAPPITQVVKGVETTIAPAIVEEKAQRSQLDIHGESISQEDVNQKFLRSLSPEWNTHTIVWTNKPEIDILSLDDLYNNLKIYEPEVKGTSSSNTYTQNVAFMSSNSTSNINGSVNTAHDVTTASTQATAVNLTTIDNLIDAVICSFFATLVSCDGLGGYDWSNQAKDGQTNFALMAYFSTSSNSEIINKCKTSLGYNVVPPPYIGNFLPPKPDLSGLKEFVKESIVNEPTVKKPTVEASEAKANGDKPKDGNPQQDLQDKGVIDSECSRHMTGNISYLTDDEEIDGGYLAFGGNPKEGKITSRGNAGTKACDDARKARMETVDEDPRQESKCKDQQKKDDVNITNNVNTASTYGVNVVSAKTNNELPFDPDMPALEDISTFNFSSDQEDADKKANMNNMDTTIQNKKDERGIMIRNKARLVAQGHTQEEGIDYDEVFVPVARIKSIRLFLAYASFKDFVVYQMNVKSAFLYGKIKEEVYVCQPLGFEDPDFPDKVHKVEKALYGLHQAPRAWYESLLTYLLDNGFHKGKIDKTLFIRRYKDDILLVQVYVDDIIFGLTKKELLKHKQDGIFISQDKYVAKILKKYGFSEVKNASTPIEIQNPLLKDEDGKEVDVHIYRSMIGSLMYLASLMPDIMFAVCACARYQVNLKVLHLHAVKRIFRDLQLEDAEGVDCLPNAVIFEQLTLIGNMKRVGKGSSGRDTPLFATMMVQVQEDMGEDEAVNEEMDNSLKRAVTTTTSLDAEQDRGVNIPQSGEDSLKLTKLMELCTKLQQRVLDLETTKTTQAMEIESLKKIRIANIDANEDITLVGTHDEQMFDADQDLGGKEVFVTQQDEKVVEKEVDAAQTQVTTAATTPIISIDEATLAQALAELKYAKPKAKAKGIVFHEPEEAQQEVGANIELIESWDDVQVKIDADYQLAKRLQAEEQHELNNKEKAKLFMQLLEKKRKFFAEKRKEEKRNKPPTQAKKRKIICTYLKNMEGKKLTDLKNKSFDSIKKMFDRAFKWVNIFVDYKTELVKESSKKAKEEVTEGSSKRAGTELEQESVKKQKIDDDEETYELKQLVNIIPDEEGVGIDAIPLAVKPPSIIDGNSQRGKENLLPDNQG
nr:retrovirus-related Pol polyprotein from transposon TNT 1-94 [Tanacetum cinerariifolium]